jgi:hypothetical protein
MAGTLTVSTLNDSSGVLATQNGMSGICKAWANFNGTTSTIRASFNVSSLTRNGTGIYTINFTTAMPDTNYCALFLATVIGTGNGSTRTGATGTSATGSYQFTGYNGSGTIADFDFCEVAIFR